MGFFLHKKNYFVLAFCVLFWILQFFINIFYCFSWIKTKVTIKSYQGYYWKPEISKNWRKQQNRVYFFTQRAKKALDKGQTNLIFGFFDQLWKEFFFFFFIDFLDFLNFFCFLFFDFFYIFCILELFDFFFGFFILFLLINTTSYQVSNKKSNFFWIFFLHFFSFSDFFDYFWQFFF